MKALCVRQPYAEFIAAGLKTLEVRTWSTPYRGPLLLVASGALAGDWADWHVDGHPDPDVTLPRGAAVCVVTLTDVIRPAPVLEDADGNATDDDARTEQERLACCTVFDDMFLWVLANPIRLAEPFPVRGKLKIFDVDVESPIRPV